MFSRRATSIASLTFRAPRPFILPSRPFHSTASIMVKAGDPLPDIDLVEGSPGNKVNLSKVLKGKGLIIGVPAAFSPTCSDSHVPGYLSHPKLKDAGEVFVVSVNDAFVTKAWGKALDPSGTSGIRFLGDPSCKFTEALDVTFDAPGVFGNVRSKRYAMLVENGKVKEAYVEPDSGGLAVSAADKVLG